MSAVSHRVGIAGSGAIGLASAAWLCQAGHHVTLWSPRSAAVLALRAAPLHAVGVLDGVVQPSVAESAAELCRAADVIVIAVPANGHKVVMDALLPSLRDGQVVIVSSMASLSALYLFEAAQRSGRHITVASLGTTVFTARRESPTQVRVMTRRQALGVSALPTAHTAAVVAQCSELFGPGLTAHTNTLASALSNINPAAHGPLALFNWTRIERAEAWPQYHYLTPRVAAVIEQLEAERQTLAQAFGLEVSSIEQHFAQSFGTQSTRLADIAAELHTKRGGPPGPTQINTRFFQEDMPYGLVFCATLGRIAGVPMPATQTIIDAASLISGQNFATGNDLLVPLGLAQETVAGLLMRVN